MSNESAVKLTVILPVRNEEKYIRNTLTQLAGQDYPSERFEILVVDGNSTDRTREIVIEFVKQHGNVDIKLLSNPARLSSAARNIGVAHGTGEYFLVIDGHVHIPDSKLLSNAVNLAVKNNALCLGRPQPLNPPGLSAFESAVAVARQSSLAHSGESYVYSSYEGWVSPISVGVMYHRSVFAAVGKFDEKFDAAEDLEFNYRVEQRGIRCYISPKLMIYYFPRNSLAKVFRQMMRYGYGRALFIYRHPERFTVETIIPAAFVLTVVVLGLSGVAWSLPRGLLTALLLVYALVLILEGLRINIKCGKRYFMEVPAIIATIHAGLGAGFLLGFGKSIVRINGGRAGYNVDRKK